MTRLFNDALSRGPLADSVTQGSAASAVIAQRIAEGSDALVCAIDREADELGRIDAVAGDGDHGIGMQRGIQAASEAAHGAADAGAGASTTLARAASAWADRAGGTSGALWGLALNAIARTLDDQTVPDASAVADAASAGLFAMTSFGKAEVGDKTMIDAFAPFVARLRKEVAGGAPLPAAWACAAAEASEAADATARISAKRGRARAHGDASIGTPDAGAVSFALLVSTIADLLAPRR